MRAAVATRVWGKLPGSAPSTGSHAPPISASSLLPRRPTRNCSFFSGCWNIFPLLLSSSLHAKSKLRGLVITSCGRSSQMSLHAQDLLIATADVPMAPSMFLRLRLLQCNCGLPGCHYSNKLELCTMVARLQKGRCAGALSFDGRAAPLIDARHEDHASAPTLARC